MLIRRHFSFNAPDSLLLFLVTKCKGCMGFRNDDDAYISNRAKTRPMGTYLSSPYVGCPTTSELFWEDDSLNTCYGGLVKRFLHHHHYHTAVSPVALRFVLDMNTWQNIILIRKSPILFFHINFYCIKKAKKKFVNFVNL